MWLLGWVACSGDEEPPPCDDPTCPNPTAVVSGPAFATAFAQECAADAEDSGSTAWDDDDRWSAWRCETDTGRSVDVIERDSLFTGRKVWYDAETGEPFAGRYFSDVEQYCCGTSFVRTEGPIPRWCARQFVHQCD